MKDRWTENIDEITEEFLQSFGHLTLAQLNWKPNPEVWSIGQNIDHIITINGTYFPVISATSSGTSALPFLSKFPFMVSFLGRIVLKSVQPDGQKKIKTFPIWEPTSSGIQSDIWDRFERHQAELKALIQSSSDLVDKGTVISSPANKNIVYKLETAFDIIVSHERRHVKQSSEVKSMGKM